MAKVLDLARKRSTTFVELSYGTAPTFVRYTDVDQDTVFEGNTYLSRPTMAIKLPPYTGMLVEKPLRITLPSDTFIDALSKGEPHAHVSVRVALVLESDTPGVPSDDVQELFLGLVVVTVHNVGGKLNQAQIRCVNWKHEADRPSGLQANEQCYFRFQRRGCVVDSPEGSGTFISAVTPTSPATRSVTVLSISSHVLTLTASPSGGPFTDRLFHRGFFELDELRLGIREWDPGADDKVFLMERPAPSSWVGELLTLHQGCDKSILTCELRYANNDFFGGFGVGIRDYNPLFEVRD